MSQILQQGVAPEEIVKFLQTSGKVSNETATSSTVQPSGTTVQAKSEEGVIQRKEAASNVQLEDGSTSGIDFSGTDLFGITLPGFKKIEPWKVALLIEFINGANPSFSLMIQAMSELTKKYNVTIGVGPNISGGAGGGFSFGAGIVLAPGAVMGFYGSVVKNIVQSMGSDSIGL